MEYCSLIFLDEITERQWLDSSDGAIISSSLQEVSLLGKLGCTLEVYLDSRLRGFGLGSLILLLSLQDFLLALGLPHVLDTNMNTLFNNSSIDYLVDTHTHSRLGDVENDSSSSVVSLVGHALVDRGIGKDVHIVANLDIHQVLRKVNRSLVSEAFRKHVARTRPKTKRVRHLVSSLQETFEQQAEENVRNSFRENKVMCCPRRKSPSRLQAELVYHLHVTSIAPLPELDKPYIPLPNGQSQIHSLCNSAITAGWWPQHPCRSTNFN